MIHIGRRSTLMTLCGKPVARRWWVEAEHEEYGQIGPLGVFRIVKPVGADCPACLKVQG